ncbi:MAG: hypothetical protein P8J37_05080 [Fuerstiella sp.]|nr:hypothetical protein [Fuerstiella sp.]
MLNFTPAKENGASAGITLTEVLMSMMIMSIGVSLVASLFPISALRSAQATKLTNSAILKYNVEALLRARPELLFDPDGDFVNSTSDSQFYWTRLTEHFQRRSEKNYIIDPAGYFSFGASYNYGPAARNNNNGVVDVNVVPPNNRAFCDYFGNRDPDNTPSTPPEPYAVLPRYDGGLRAAALPTQYDRNVNQRDFEILAAAMTKLGDGWDTVVDDFAVSAITNNNNQVIGVTLDDEAELGDIVTSTDYASILSIGDPELTRITVFSVNGRFSQSYPLIAVSGQQCTWNQALPIEFGGAVGRVLIQTNRISDFNWILTVRRGSDGRAVGVDVVVLFSDGRDADDERVFEAQFTAGQFDVIVAKTGGSNENGDPAEPVLKRGGFMLDVENARWYRVSNYEENTADNTGSTYRVTLENAAVSSTPGAAGSTSGAMFLPGVVEVFPLGSVALPDHMTPRAFR